MKSGRRAALAFSWILLFAAAVRADMMPVSEEDAASRQPSNVCAKADLQGEALPDSFDCAGAADLDLWAGELLPGAAAVGQDSEVQNLRSLSEGRNSLQFCLSALVSLGLCCCAQWVKKLSLGFVPDWYHEGGPLQIGHSHALQPGTLYPVLSCCFIQPAGMEYNPLAQYHLRIVIPFWRKSQFTAVVLAARGPPEMS
jgi:hypothetical protein